MSRAERMCRAAPTGWLELTYRLSPIASWRMAAWFELRYRETEEAVALATDDDSGPWPVSLPVGMH